MLLLVLQRLALEFFLNMLFFPIWWYSKGTKKVLIGCINWIKATNIQMSPGLWLKNIFVPMYGQTDWQGRLMSFFMRLVNVIGRSLALFIYSIVIILVFFFWLIFPILLTGMILISFSSLM